VDGVRGFPAALLAVSLAAPLAAEPGPSKIDPWLQGRFEQVGPTEFLVLLDDSTRPPVDASLKPHDLYAALTQSARASQAKVLADLKVRGVAARPFYIVNGILVAGDAALAGALAARPEVSRIVGSPRVLGVRGRPDGGAAPALDPVEWNIGMVGADDVWSTYGTQGEGIVVASADTGVDWSHPELTGRYRGYAPIPGDVDHAYAWHDAFGVYGVPFDDYDHGTATTGTMVAINGIGMSPAATWIACRNMENGFGTPASYIDCMEWTLAPYPPGGDPMTDGRPDMAPHIVNNSWVCPPSEGCDAHTLDEALARVRQAGILMIAAAGNDGPSCSTVAEPPALSADVFSVGAVDNVRNITGFSSRGPVNIDGSGRLKPELVAPGRLVNSTARGGGHRILSGTSLAAPHVSGAAALLWSNRPGLRGLVGLTHCILARSASPTAGDPSAQTCGGIPSGTLPNHVLGHGLLDIYAAFGLASTDADPAPDVCDCAPADPSAYGAPGEVTEVRVGGAGSIAWNSQDRDTGPGILYDVLRGDLATLSQGVDAAGCLAHDLTTTSTNDPGDPAPGTGLYYLVRARNVCGTSTWGAGGQNTACPD